MPNLNKYFSQWDSDNGGFNGLCVETCLKMADCYYHDREIPLTEIVKNGDGSGSNTTEHGAIKAAQYLKLNPKPTNMMWKDINQQDLKTWFDKGNLVMAFVNYGLIPAKYKQDQFFKGTHAILLTAISDDLQSIRYADPNFADVPLHEYAGHRVDGWMNNNKWISWADFAPAWKGVSVTKPYWGMQLDLVKEITPPTDPCSVFKEQIKDISNRLTNTQIEVESKIKIIESLNKTIEALLKNNQELDELTKTLRDENKKYALFQEQALPIIQQVNGLKSENKRLSDSLGETLRQLGVKTERVVELEKELDNYQHMGQLVKDATVGELLKEIFGRIKPTVIDPVVRFIKNILNKRGDK